MTEPEEDPDAPKVRYNSAPYLDISYACSGWNCGTSTIEWEDGEWMCSDCKTVWSDPDNGQLYPEWSGEPYDGPLVDTYGDPVERK